MPVYFVADVHLSAGRPGQVAAFLGFLEHQAPRAERLYILGDLFDLWLGDDDDTPPHPEVIEALADLTRRGTPVFVMHGNHDFTLNGTFEARTACRLIPDPSTVDVYGTPVLLMHGDTLCTDDVEYQAFRTMIRRPDRLRDFLKLPLAERAAQAADIRRQTRAAVQEKPLEIMDVNDQAVTKAFRDHKAGILVHGHTHRPAVHKLEIDGRPATRIVLGDWYQADSVLVWDQDGPRPCTVADLEKW